MESIQDIFTKNFTFNNPVIKRIKGFTMVSNSLLSSTEFNPYEKMILIILAKYKMNKTKCWPSIKTISKEVGCSETTIKKYKKTLESKNMIITLSDKKIRSNVYSSTTNVYMRQTTKPQDTSRLV